MNPMVTPFLLGTAGVLTLLSLQVPFLLIPAAFVLGFGLRAAITHARQ